MLDRARARATAKLEAMRLRNEQAEAAENYAAEQAAASAAAAAATAAEAAVSDARVRRRSKRAPA